MTISSFLSRLMNKSNKKYPNLMAERDRLIRERDDLIRQRDELMSYQNRLIEASSRNVTPALVFNTLPKSASVFIAETLSRSLDKPLIQISPGYFPKDYVDFRAISKLIAIRGMAQSHLDASDLNLRFLGEVGKIVLQFRDPRQSTLSWLHHLDRLKQEGQDGFLKIVSPALPDRYFEMSFQEKLDYQIAIYLKQAVSWMSDWIDYQDGLLESQQQRILITTYEDFVSDRVAYFRKILSFIGSGSSPDEVFSGVIPSREKNFRLGNPQEWKTVYSSRQLELADQIIPLAMRHRFGWG